MSTNRQAMAYADLERLESDLRALSPLGIERAAWGWDQHEQDNLQAFHAAEKAALQAVDDAGQVEAWDEWRRRLFYEFEGKLALEAWKAEHQRHSSTSTKRLGPLSGPPLGCLLDRGSATSSTPRWSAPWPKHCPGCCPSDRLRLHPAGKARVGRDNVGAFGP